MADAELEQACRPAAIHPHHERFYDDYVLVAFAKAANRSERLVSSSSRRKAGQVAAAASEAVRAARAEDRTRLRCRGTEARKSILDQILHPEAADRLGRIRLVKEQRATEVEDRLIMLARTGQLRQKVTEDQLKELLSAVSESSRQAEQEKIVVSRRKGWDDDDDDDLLDL
ncbi:hypothetical protein DL764_009399 [Monosporascus ibericus]|uniref:DNA-binding TFAR19-related protein n=1 Tax=Monosporascus ibericus TaxID=155417 RepID=A0A4Q4SXW1_9PEZI|nr:hypothetical protein DL764_009399 [Monosporascus ibericus]